MEEHNLHEASKLLSLTKQTADTVADMMRVLYETLHPGEDYTDDTTMGQSITKRCGNKNRREDESSDNDNVDGDDKGLEKRRLLANFEFSEEFFDAFYQLV